MQLVIDLEHAGAGGFGDRRHTRLSPLDQRIQKILRVHRQREPPIVGTAALLPLWLGNEQRLAAAETEAVFDPDGAVA
jgi:hypothetical protein